MSTSGNRQHAEVLVLQTSNLKVFTEPRGAMRICQLGFTIFTALVLRYYSVYVSIEYCNKNNPSKLTLQVEFPYNLKNVSGQATCGDINTNINLYCDISSQAWFLYITCWISVIYVTVTALVYAIFSEYYDNNVNIAIVDFFVSLVLTVLWFASFSAWAYGLCLLTNFTDPHFLMEHLQLCSYRSLDFMHCFSIVRGSVSGLIVSLISTFLSYFLWLAGLWFLYKDTPLYAQYEQRQGVDSVDPREKRVCQISPCVLK